MDFTGAGISEIQARYAALIAALLRAGQTEAADELREWADENMVFTEDLDER